MNRLLFLILFSSATTYAAPINCTVINYGIAVRCPCATVKIACSDGRSGYAFNGEMEKLIPGFDAKGQANNGQSFTADDSLKVFANDKGLSPPATPQKDNLADRKCRVVTNLAWSVSGKGCSGNTNICNMVVQCNNYQKNGEDMSGLLQASCAESNCNFISKCLDDQSVSAVESEINENIDLNKVLKVETTQKAK